MVTITIDMDRLCVECSKPGVVGNTLCLNCTRLAMNPNRRMRSLAGRAVQERWRGILRKSVGPESAKK